MTTQLGSHVLKSKDGHPPAPGTLVTLPAVVVWPPLGAVVVAISWKMVCCQKYIRINAKGNI